MGSHMASKCNIGWGILAAILLAGCSTTPPEDLPTQTPIFVVVTGQTDDATPVPRTQTTDEVFPTPTICRAAIVEQPFENGYMFWVGGTLQERCQTEHSFAPGSGEIWVVISPSGQWLRFRDTWDETTDPSTDPSLVPPAGLLQPERGFGRVWREELTDEQREALGWATLPEVLHITTYRYDIPLSDEGEALHTLISFGEQTFFFGEADGTVEVLP
jgi:hypothetical protein